MVDNSTAWIRVPVEASVFSLPIWRCLPYGTPRFLPSGIWGLRHKAKAPDREADHSPPSVCQSADMLT